MNLETSKEAVSGLGFFIKDAEWLGKINEFSYENFLRIYKNTDSNYFYNLLSNTIGVDENLSTQTYYEIIVRKSVPWTTLSYNEYRTMNLWWLIMETNKITNPLEYPKPGTKLRILYPQYVKLVIDTAYNQTRGLL
jgi:hypothetical protein